jgi:hypothetical protein
MSLDRPDVESRVWRWRYLALFLYWCAFVGLLWTLTFSGT